eukprot:TRINITY_DN2997_c2_g1_i1.p1 TRINITY_DN2997_c2_g1~~TRINITY_DN2997_c2_g1_i1.p1  ORF type:complete len:790 (+),score=121.71 TRINITY_DN2997_c2_g1_i1:142-2511(+)
MRVLRYFPVAVVVVASLFPIVFAGAQEEKEEGGGFILGIALIGCLILSIGLFYLTHSYDADVRRTTWAFMSNTVSIFCAVLVFSVVDEFFEHYVMKKYMEDASLKTTIFVNNIWTGIWYSTILIAIASSAALGKGLQRRRDIIENELSFNSRRNLITASLLFAHTMGFAGIDGWGVEQQAQYGDSPLESSAVVPKAFVKWYIIIRFCAYVRKFCAFHFVESEAFVALQGPRGYLRVAEDGTLHGDARLHDGDGDPYDEALYEVFDAGSGEKLEVETLIQRGRSARGKPLLSEPILLRPKGNDFYVGSAGVLSFLGAAANLELSFRTGVCFGEVRSFLNANPPFASVGLQDDSGQLVEYRLIKIEEYDELIESAQEAIEDGENDVYGLFCSFLIVQSLRFWCGGTLPDQKGVEKGDGYFEHSGKEIAHLYLCAFMLLMGVPFFQVPVLTQKHNVVHGITRTWQCFCSPDGIWLQEVRHTFERFIQILTNISLMGFCWCFMYATEWWIASLHLANRDRAVVKFLLASTLSLLSFIMILVFDKIADTLEHIRKNNIASVFRQLMSCAGILIGFSWESTFDVALDKLVEHCGDPKLEPAFKTAIGILSTCIIVPAWIRIIIPKTTDEGRYIMMWKRARHDMLEKMTSSERLKDYRAFREGVLKLETDSTLGACTADKAPTSPVASTPPAVRTVAAAVSSAWEAPMPCETKRSLALGGSPELPSSAESQPRGAFDWSSAMESEGENVDLAQQLRELELLTADLVRTGVVGTPRSPGTPRQQHHASDVVGSSETG